MAFSFRRVTVVTHMHARLFKSQRSWVSWLKSWCGNRRTDMTDRRRGQSVIADLMRELVSNESSDSDISSRRRRLRVNQQVILRVRDEAPVFHCTDFRHHRHVI